MAHQRWTQPPGWPQPPANWSPPPGWQPDPSWPTPPADWVWWQPIPRSKLRRFWLTLVIVVPALTVIGLVGALVLTQALDDRAGCGSVDPTDPANYSSIVIWNDSNNPVVIANCVGGYCKGYELPAHLAPGARYADDASCAATGSAMTSWRITSEDGQPLGFIAVNTPRKHDGLVFRVSRSSSDRSVPTPAG